MPSPKTSVALLKKGTLEIISEEELLNKVELSEKTGAPLRVKLGIDASGPEIHLGFAVVLRKLRQFQELGHRAVLIVGDFTGKIGDPAGRSKTRVQLTDDEIKKNIERYREQIFKILIPEKTEFCYNSQWSNPLGAKDIIDLTSKYTVARILERDDFSNRLKDGTPVYVHEILYPIFQGYDSVATKSDVELGGSDQKWNLLVGRELQREFGQPPQVVMTLPLLEGTDGKLKMSKSYNNYIGITEPPREIYGKILSVPDGSIINYFQLCTDYTDAEIVEVKKRLVQDENPKILKDELAQAIITIYHSKTDAAQAAEEFERIFKSKGLPDEIPEFLITGKKIAIVDLLVKSGLLPSKNEARRKLTEGAVYIENERVTDQNLILDLKKPFILKVGKRRFLKIILSE
jgi:tyrosyl-tRNA synthetase